MVTVAGTDKALSEMSDNELSAIIANCTHLIKRRRYANGSHLKYLEARLETCRLELALRR